MGAVVGPRRALTRLRAGLVTATLVVAALATGLATGDVARATDAGGVGIAAAPGEGAAGRTGYWLLGDGGRVWAFGDATDAGSVDGATVAIAADPSTDGYWVLRADGGVAAFGSAAQLGPFPPTAFRPGERLVELAATPTGQGLWAFTSAGRVLVAGDADHHGDILGLSLAGEIVAATPTVSGGGYWMLGTDGGVFSHGDAEFLGSTGDIVLDQPAVGIAPAGDGEGYWFVARDGGIFAFGSAVFRGAIPGVALECCGLGAMDYLAAPIVGMVPDPDGDGYLLLGSDGGVFTFAAVFEGSLGATAVDQTIVDVAPLPVLLTAEGETLGSGFGAETADPTLSGTDLPTQGGQVDLDDLPTVGVPAGGVATVGPPVGSDAPPYDPGAVGTGGTGVVVPAFGDLPGGDAQAAFGGRAQHAMTNLAQPSWLAWDDVPAQVGQLFMWNGSRYVPGCSGVVVGRWTVLTAGHCLQRPLANGAPCGDYWPAFAFVPRKFGSYEPYGAWTTLTRQNGGWNIGVGLWNEVCQGSEWGWGGDFALIEFPTGGSADRLVGDHVGTFPVLLDTAGIPSARRYSVGYPTEGGFAGGAGWPWRCDGRVETSQTHPNPYHWGNSWYSVGFGCTHNGGNSGGPVFATHGDRWHVVGVNSSYGIKGPSCPTVIAQIPGWNATTCNPSSRSAWAFNTWTPVLRSWYYDQLWANLGAG